MKWIACLALLVGCQTHSEGESKPAPQPQGSQQPAPQQPAPQQPAPPVQPSPSPSRAPVTDDYRADITTLCDVVHLSGADTGPPDERWMRTSMWLPSHLKTEDAHTFLVDIQPLANEQKAQALEAEAHRVGLQGCALATELRKS